MRIQNDYNGADLNARNGNDGTALMFATLFGRHAIVPILLAAGADATLRDVRGLNARDLAINKATKKRLRCYPSSSINAYTK